MLALLRALGVSTWREIRTLNSIEGNNFFYLVLLLSMQPEAVGFIWMVLGGIVLVPVLAAPFARIPAQRLRLWPLSRRSERGLRMFSRPEMQAAPWLWNLLPTLELRQYVRTLDFVLAGLMALSGLGYRYLYPEPQADALPVLALLVVLALSTLGQSLFALDGYAGRARWRLSSRGGVWILARKSLTLLGMGVVLTVGVEPVAGLAGMLAALAVGHHISVLGPKDGVGWRFMGGHFFPHGFFQVIGLFSCGIAASRGEWVYLGLAGGAYVVSLAVYGVLLERAALQKL
ncbi:MAG: hypothetical protein ACK52Z_07610 [Acidobacteriota bacterium]